MGKASTRTTMTMRTRITNMARDRLPTRLIRSEAHDTNSDHLSPPGRGRPSAARSGEGGPNSPATPVSPHATPLATSKSDVSDFDQSLNARTREHPGSGGERENVTASPDYAESEKAAAPPAYEAPAGAQAALYRLMAWLSPAYPVGAFSYSSGLEWAVEAGGLTHAEALAAWIAVMIGEGGGFCDAVLFAHAHRAATALDHAAVRSVAELAAAFAPSRERHLETIAQGGAFLEVTRAAWSCAALDRLTQVWPGPYAYPIAVAAAAARPGVSLAPARHHPLPRVAG